MYLSSFIGSFGERADCFGNPSDLSVCGEDGIVELLAIREGRSRDLARFAVHESRDLVPELVSCGVDGQVRHRSC